MVDLSRRIRAADLVPANRIPAEYEPPEDPPLATVASFRRSPAPALVCPLMVGASIRPRHDGATGPGAGRGERLAQPLAFCASAIITASVVFAVLSASITCP